MKVKHILLPILLIASKIVYAQAASANELDQQTEMKSIYVKLLVGFWESTDTLKHKIEFVDSRVICWLQQKGGGTFEFMKDSFDRVSSNGFIAAWPPFNCDLKLISKDTLQVLYSHFGSDAVVQSYVKLK